MFKKLLNFFGDETPKQKLIPQLFVQYNKKDSETLQIEQKTIKYDYKPIQQFQGWKRLKFRSFDTRKVLSNMETNHFIDPDFPHTNASISDEDSQIQFEWKRIPHFIKYCIYSSAVTFNNFERISLNNKKLKQALLFMYRTHPNKFKQMLAHDCNDVGLYEFKLYNKGIIENVIIDDYVPVVNGVHPLMVGPVVEREIFPMLIQKALAKVCGGYDKIPENLDQLLEIIFCGPLRKTKIDELTDTKVVASTVDNTMNNKGVAAFISKNQPKIRSFGISENQIYHIIDKFEVQLKNEPSIDLYELVSQKKLASWNGKFSHNDAEWDKVDQAQKSVLFKHLKQNKSFFISGNDASRIFDHLIAFDGTDINNKQWIECTSQVEYASFATFQLTQSDTVFLRVTSIQPVRTSFILAKHGGKDYYHFLKGRFHESTYSLEMTVQLEPGKYIICVHHDWILNKSGPYSIFLSSNTHALLLPAQTNSYPNFLQLMFKNLSDKAKKVQPTPDFLTMKKFYSIGMLPKETGFAFIDFSLVGINQKQVFIDINPKVLKQQSWQIIEPNANRSSIHLQKGSQQQLLLILKTHKYVSQQTPQFPSTAFNVKA